MSKSSLVLTKGILRSMTTSRTAQRFSGFFTGQKRDPNDICVNKRQKTSNVQSKNSRLT